MLYTKSVYPDTFALLNQIMQKAELNAFCLVGGTALALQIGHRISVDLDLFTSQTFDINKIIIHLSSIGKTENITSQNQSLQLEINQIKIDVFKYPYSFIDNFIRIDNIRLLPIETIAIMKMVAICNRGAKKDFVDMYFLLEIYDLSQLIDLFQKQFPNLNTLHLFKSLIYFEDADIQPSPIMLKNISWETMKSTIYNKVQKYLGQKK
jgi:hypothetical protein